MTTRKISLDVSEEVYTLSKDLKRRYGVSLTDIFNAGIAQVLNRRGRYSLDVAVFARCSGIVRPSYSSDVFQGPPIQRS